MNKSTPSVNQNKNPLSFVPSAYFIQGLPYTIVVVTSVIIFENFGISNTEITFWSSLLYLPWVLKMFWGPIVDGLFSKREWIIYTQFFAGFLIIATSFVFLTPYYFYGGILFFGLLAFVSATHDIALDGFYMIALDTKQQAFYVGIRSLFFRMAMWYGNGILVVASGWMLLKGFSVSVSWFIPLLFTGLIFVGFATYHKFFLPTPESSVISEKESRLPFKEVFINYFTQTRIVPILLFILLYRLGESMLTKIVPIFLLDSVENGGLGLNNIDVGFAQGTLGLSGLIIGGILGGWAISRYGFRKSILPMALALNVPDVFYYLLTLYPPVKIYIYSAIFIEMFGYGIGYSAFAVFLMQIAKGNYKTSHYAISTGLMSFGMMVPGMISGYLQEMFGYQEFFLIVLALTIPGMFMIKFIPKE